MVPGADEHGWGGDFVEKYNHSPYYPNSPHHCVSTDFSNGGALPGGGMVKKIKMTLSIAWVRKVGKAEELVIATDSRVTSGQAWDCCPKIKILSRKDSVMCFKGETEYAYPMMEQVGYAIESFPKLASRALDLTDTRGHIIRVISKMREFIHNDIEPTRDYRPAPPETSFLLAGYSWKMNRFYIWELFFSKTDNIFKHRTQSTIMKNPIALIVDAANFMKEEKDFLSSKSIRKRIFDKLAEKGKTEKDGFDMEPFEVLRDIIRNNEDWAIGGSPQLVKVYKHMNVMPYALFWPNKASKQVTFLGRPLLGYEQLPYLIMDPDSMEVIPSKISNEELIITHDDGRFEKYQSITHVRKK